MEAEEAEANKSDNNPLSLGIILFPVFAVTVVVFLGYWSFPPIANSLQVVTVWFDWFCLVTRNLFFVLLFVSALVFLIYLTFPKTTVKIKPDLYDQYITDVHPPPDSYFREFGNYDDGYYSNSNHKGIVSTFEAVKERHCYGRVVMEEQGDSKGYRRKRSEKNARKVEYRRTESERVAKTTSCGSQTMDELSSEEFRMTVEIYKTERKKMFIYQNGVVDQRQNVVIDQCVPQNNVANQWLKGVPQWENDVVEWQRSPDDRTGRRSHRSRNHRLEGGSGPYLASVALLRNLVP